MISFPAHSRMFRDFYFTLNFVREFLSQNNLLELYQQVINNFQQLQSGQNEETEKNFQDSWDNLVNTLSLVNYSSWSPAKISILNHIGGYDLLGGRIIDRINDTFQTNLGNPASTVQKLEELKSETNSLLSRTQQLIETLHLEEEVIVPAVGRKIVEFSFQDRASLKNFWEVEDRAGELNYIIRTVTRLTGADFESAKITSISTASDPISVAVDFVQKSADCLLAIAKAAIEIKKIKDIFLTKKKNAAELGLKKETVKVVLKDLDDQKDQEHRKRIGEVSVSITKEYGSAKPEANDQHEIENMVGIALDKIATLVNDGAKVLDPDEIKPVGEPKQAVLGNAYAEVKKIGKKIEPLLLEESKEREQQRKKKMQKDLEIKREKTPPTPSTAKGGKNGQVKKNNSSELSEKQDK